MTNLNSIVTKARTSGFYKWLLNVGLNRMIPFNKPHGFRIDAIAETHIETYLPYKRRNFNHIKGLHACALATLSEFTTGFLLISRLDPAQYRLILKSLKMEYYFQGKMAAKARFEVTDVWLEENILNPLRSSEAILVVCEVKIHDLKGNHLSTGFVEWQIKDWSKVKTKA